MLFYDGYDFSCVTRATWQRKRLERDERKEGENELQEIASSSVDGNLSWNFVTERKRRGRDQTLKKQFQVDDAGMVKTRCRRSDGEIESRWADWVLCVVTEFISCHDFDHLLFSWTYSQL